MSQPSRSPFARPPGTSTSADLANDLERRLDLDEDFSFVNPSVVSSLAQLSARGSASARRGESSVSLHTPRIPGGGFSETAGANSAPSKIGGSKLLRAVFIGVNELESMCLGFVGNKARFCIAPKTKGGRDCGVISHQRQKMKVAADTFWMPGGSILNKPTARSELCIPCSDLSEGSLMLLRDALCLEHHWPAQFKLVMDRVEAAKARRASRSRSSGSKSSEIGSVHTSIPEDPRVEDDDSLGANDVDDVDMMDREFVPEEVTINPAAGWEAACGALQTAIHEMAATIASQTRIIAALHQRDHQEDIEVMQENSAVLQSQLGDLYDLVQNHGSLSEAMAALMASATRSSSDVAMLTSEIEALNQAMAEFSRTYDIPPNDLVRLIDKLAEKMTRQNNALATRIWNVETTTLPTGTAAPAGGAVTFDLDTIFGTSHVGGNTVDISMGYMVSKLQSLSTTMGTLESRMHTTGINFDGLNFPSDEEFAAWYMTQNPRGLGMASFVDVVSIWAFLNVSQTSAEWLSMMEKSAKLGLGPLDTSYIHSMTYKYPPKFAGKVSAILSTEHIKMLKSMDSWRGTSEGMSMGDGIHDQLLADMRSAATNHAQYCHDHLPEGKLRSLAIRTGTETLAFFISLVGYIEAEITTLGNLNIQDSHILLLLSNQVVRMCDDIHEIRTHGSRCSLDNLPLAAAKFASVTLRALACMNTFAKARFKDHPAINSAYMRFLTCSVASQSSIGVKEAVEALAKRMTKVEKVAADAATKESVTKVDNKVVALQRAGNQGGVARS